MPKPGKKNEHFHRKRPIAVIIIALITLGEILLRVYWVTRYVLDFAIWSKGIPQIWGGGGFTDAGNEFAVSAFRLVWVLVGIAVLIGAMRMRRWSWVMLVAWVGTSLTIGVIRYFYHAPGTFGAADFAVMAADVVLVFALNQTDVQRIYHVRRDDVERIG